jgi:4-alpha-glucanotransferase
MELFTQRRAGILLHPTSLPGSAGNGDLGPEAYRFVDFIADCGLKLWQTLPLGPPHEDLSPYQCLSVHAGNFRLISLHLLVDQGWLDDAVLDESGDLDAQRKVRLTAAYNGFQRKASEDERESFVLFKKDHSRWLDDFALYQAVRTAQGERAWYDWPDALRDRDADALDGERKRLAAQLEQVRFEQFLFYSQWKRLRCYANDRGVLLFGDIPIFVAHDSADVWAHREWFSVDENGRLEVVAGVPPDYFSETGQRWGNPHYHWEALKKDGFGWWLERIRSQMEMFDLVRIDHFRGFEAYWEINAQAETAIDGRWVKGPGESFFQVLKQVFGDLPLVAEDLGVITQEVTALRKQFDLPGMKILQFAFDGASDNPYLPHNHEELSVVYTGTHDNNTTLGWYQELSDDQRKAVCHYLGDSSEPMPGLLVRTALASVARLAVIPMQDMIGLDSSHRMNIPGVTEGNWSWRFEWDQVQPEHRQRLQDWIRLYGRS